MGGQSLDLVWLRLEKILLSRTFRIKMGKFSLRKFLLWTMESRYYMGRNWRVLHRRRCLLILRMLLVLIWWFKSNWEILIQITAPLIWCLQTWSNFWVCQYFSSVSIWERGWFITIMGSSLLQNRGLSLQILIITEKIKILLSNFLFEQPLSHDLVFPCEQRCNLSTCLLCDAPENSVLLG